MKTVAPPPSDFAPSRRELLFAALPGVVSLALYYSLAMHMWFALGRWPTAIGERGFPQHLVWHVSLEHHYFGSLIVFVAVVLPLALLLCAFVPRVRRFVMLMFVAALAFMVCCILRLFVPTEFLTWWLD